MTLDCPKRRRLPEAVAGLEAEELSCIHLVLLAEVHIESSSEADAEVTEVGRRHGVPYPVSGLQKVLGEEVEAVDPQVTGTESLCRLVSQALVGVEGSEELQRSAEARPKV